MLTSSDKSLGSSGEKRRTQEQNSLRVSEEDDENKGNFSVLAQMTRFLDSIMKKSSDISTAGTNVPQSSSCGLKSSSIKEIYGNLYPCC